MADPIAQDQAENEAEKSYDASDPKAVNNARKRAGRKKASELEVVRVLMNTTQGRAWMFDILQMCHISSPTFVRGDPHATSFQEGERNIGNRLLHDINRAAPDMYAKMCSEGGTDR